MFTIETQIMIAKGNLEKSLESVTFWKGHPAHLKAAQKAVKLNRKALAKLTKKAAKLAK